MISTNPPTSLQPLASLSAASGVEILLVEDDRDVAEMTAELLGAEGFSVTVARNVASAKQCLAAREIICVIVDFQMPDGDGLDLVRSVRAQHGDDIVLIALTGHMSTEGRVGQFLSEVDHYFVKPLEWDALFKVIRGLR